MIYVICGVDVRRRGVLQVGDHTRDPGRSESYISTFDVQVTIEFFDLAFGTSDVRHHPAVPRSSGRQSAVDGCPASDRPELGDDFMVYAGRQPLICSSTPSFSWQRRWTAGGPGSDTCSTSINRCIDFAGTPGAARAGGL
jgi:hypothetical protein